MCTLYLTYRAGILVFIFFIQIFFHIKTRTYRAYILRLFGNFRFLSNLRASPTGKFSIESNKFAGKLRVSMKTSYLSCLRIRAQNCIFWLFDCTVYTIQLTEQVYFCCFFFLCTRISESEPSKTALFSVRAEADFYDQLWIWLYVLEFVMFWFSKFFQK